MQMKKSVSLGTRLVVALIVLCFGIAGLSRAQNESGSISGNVLDPQHKAVPNAPVTVTSGDQKFSTSANTDNEGHYSFPVLPPGTYELSIAATGFKAFQQQGVVLHVNDKLVLPDISLEVGTISESVTVTSVAPTLKTESAELSDTLENKQMQNIAVNGRSPLSLVTLTPGVASQVSVETAGTAGISEFSANGTRNNSNNLTINGIGDIDTGLNGVQNVTVSLDSVQEFTILTGIYQAQYGRSSGAQVNLVTKSGTSQFHGSGYWYHRNEGLNANNAYLKEEAATLPGGETNPAYRRPLFRLNDPGYTIGGPIYIPGHFNSNKDKLFFFWSEEFQRQLVPVGATNVWIPTAAEASGDFSGDANPYIKDPLSSQPCNQAAAQTAGCFQGLKNGVPTLGVIPANRLYGPGLTYLQLLSNLNPSAATVSSSVPTNYSSDISSRNPRREDVLRIDYNVNSRLRLNGTYIHNANATTSRYAGDLEPSDNVPLATFVTTTPGYQWGIGGTYIFSTTLVNDFEVGVSNNSLHNPVPNILTASGSGVSLPVLSPGAVQDSFLPNLAYGSNAFNGGGATVGTAYAPFANYNTDIDVTDNVSKVWHQHTFKTGIYVQRSRKDQTSFADANGNYSFASDPSNPYDTGNGIANVATGIFDTFDQANAFLTGKYRYTNFEGYFQDTWKITPTLTLDAGLRLSWYQPQYDSGTLMSNFYPNLYNPAQAVTLAPSGTIVPGSGNPTDGIVQASGGNRYLVNNRAPQVGPRLGLAWDLMGKQQVVIRTGGGIYFDRIQGNRVFELIQNPPESSQPQILYGCINTPINCPSGAATVSSTSTLSFPPTLYASASSAKIPTVYEASFQVETKLPGGMVLDTGYVGTFSRQLTDEVNLNAIPYGATFLAQNQDPALLAAGFNSQFQPCTGPSGYTGACAKPVNFLRPFPGYGDIFQFNSGATANYNALQVSLNRRFSKGLFLEASYTYAKDLTSTPSTGIVGADFDPIYIGGNPSLIRKADYTYSGYDQRHNFVINYVYNFPNAFQSGWRHTMLDGWQISGVSRFATGFPYQATFYELGVGDNLDLCITSCFNLIGGSYGQPTITGSYTETARIALTGAPIYGNGGVLHRLNPAAFAPPTAPSLGMESPLENAFGPGWNNWDMSLQKTFAIKERYALEIRIDAFNVFNHAQWSGVNSLGVYLPTPGGPILLNGLSGTASDTTAFGTVNGARDPRILQTVLRFTF